MSQGFAHSILRRRFGNAWGQSCEWAHARKFPPATPQSEQYFGGLPIVSSFVTGASVAQNTQERRSSIGRIARLLCVLSLRVRTSSLLCRRANPARFISERPQHVLGCILVVAEQLVTHWREPRRLAHRHHVLQCSDQAASYSQARDAECALASVAMSTQVPNKTYGVAFSMCPEFYY